MRKRFFTVGKKTINLRGSIQAVNVPVTSFIEQLYQIKEGMHEQYEALENVSLKEILRWGFSIYGKDILVTNMDQLRHLWNFKFPSSKLSKGKAGAISKGEMKFIIREYLRVGINRPKTHTENAIDKSIKISYIAQLRMNKWRNTE